MMLFYFFLTAKNKIMDVRKMSKVMILTPEKASSKVTPLFLRKPISTLHKPMPKNNAVTDRPDVFSCHCGNVRTTKLIERGKK